MERVLRGRNWLAVSVLWVVCVLTPVHSSAQGAQARQAAAEAYDRGTSAFLAEDFAGAARYFEAAHRAAPGAPALIQAVRSHERAGNALRAATLALRLVDLYGDDETARSIGDPIVEAGASQYFRVDIECDAECSMDLDGTLVGHPSVFLDAGTQHTVIVHFEHGDRDEVVIGEAGDRIQLAFEAPPAPPEPPPGAEPLVREGPRVEPRSGISPVWFIIGTVATLGATGAAVWSGIDTLDAADDYEAAPSAAGLADGRDLERRSNILGGLAIGLGLTTIVLAIVTDWGGSSDDENADADSQAVTAQVGLSPEGGTLLLEGRF